ncbi:MAG: hypothetical protein AAFZ91_09275 [Pseudomonadota bacterium]
MLKTALISIAALAVIPVSSAGPVYVAKPKVTRVVVTPVPAILYAPRVKPVKAPIARYGTARVQVVNQRAYTLKQLDRLEDRIDRREDVRDRRVNLGPVDRLEDRLDTRENRRDRRH